MGPSPFPIQSMPLTGIHNKLISRYIELFGMTSSNVTGQIEFLGDLSSFWQYSPQYIQVVVDHLLESKILGLEAILAWLRHGVIAQNIYEYWAWDLLKEMLLSFKDDPLVINFVENFASDYSQTIGPLPITSPAFSMMLWLKQNFGAYLTTEYPGISNIWPEW